MVQRLPRLFLFIPLIIAAFYFISFGFSDKESLEASVDKSSLTGDGAQVELEEEQPRMSKQEIKNLIDEERLTNLHDKRFDIQSEDKVLHVETSIDLDLQTYVFDQLETVKKLKRGKPRFLAMVVLDPDTGKVLSMAGFDSQHPTDNPCLSTTFPAASVFKIVTAAAAVEQCGLSPLSNMRFNGNKYTLYKRQLTNKINKYTTRISFQDSFAQSVNPVFGKLGAMTLGKDTLEKYASAFGFNRPIAFEASLPLSELAMSDEPYKLAEVACGFNRETMLSPLHGALLSGVILNHGRFVEPTIIDTITDDEGKIVYRGEDREKDQSLKPETTEVMKKLMYATITRGTGKKSFRGFSKDPVLKKLSLGGKTGSIYNKERDVRLDWFVGYAEEKNGKSKVSIAVLVGHEKYIGTKACKYARNIIKYYYQNRFSKQAEEHLLATQDQEEKSYKVR